MSSRGVAGLLLTKLDRDGSQVTSRLGVSAPAVDVHPELNIYDLAQSKMPLQFLVCDEAQFYTIDQCDQLAKVVDELGIDVYAFGLISDFRGLLFDGTKRLLEIADQRVEMQVEARCWCGSRANNNARLVNGVIVYEGETVVVGDTDKTTAVPKALPLWRPWGYSVDLLFRACCTKTTATMNPTPNALPTRSVN
jgi:thymidine kinase